MIPPCEKEFVTLQELVNHQKDPLAVHGLGKSDLLTTRASVADGFPREIISVPAATKREAIPIQLEYKFIGECVTCYQPVLTIEIELPDKNALTAFCVNCNKKLSQKLVTPIKDQK